MFIYSVFMIMNIKYIFCFVCTENAYIEERQQKYKFKNTANFYTFNKQDHYTAQWTKSI